MKFNVKVNTPATKTQSGEQLFVRDYYSTTGFRGLFSALGRSLVGAHHLSEVGVKTVNCPDVSTQLIADKSRAASFGAPMGLLEAVRVARQLGKTGLQAKVVFGS